MKTVPRLVFVFSMAVLLAACGDSPFPNSTTGSSSASSDPGPVKRGDFAMVVRGGQLFDANCASCHGKLAQGAPGWRTVGVDGRYPAPPLDGSGHAWHHPTKALVRTIKYGTQSMGGSMPPWNDKLSEEEINSIIQWFQSRWSEEIYRDWQARDQQAQAANR